MEQERITVKAAPGLQVPMEDKPRNFITDSDPVDVDNTAYYQRRLSDGDLVQVATRKEARRGQS